MKRSTGSRWPLLLLPALLLVAACGVPISAEEITATAESQKTSQQLSTIGEAATSSRASDAAAQDSRFSGAVTPSPVSTLGALTTGTPGTPGASTTPGATTTPGASTTPNASSTPNASLLAATTGTPGTPQPSGTPGTPTVSGTPSPQPTAAVPTSGFGAEVVNLVNDYRVSKGLSRLRPEPYITTASNNYARQMGQANTFGHAGPDGSSSEGRMAAAGYPGEFCGENIAAGQPTPQEAFNVWKNSPAHNAIMLAANPRDIGVGYFYVANSTYKHYWVMMTGRPTANGCGAS